LEMHATFLALDETDEKGRLALARRARDLLDTLIATGQAAGAGGAKKTVETLARFDLGQINAERYATCVKRAHDVAQALAAAAWDTLDLAEGQGAEGQALLQVLRGTAQADQLTADLIDALDRTRRDVPALVKRNVPPPPPPVVPVRQPGKDADPPVPDKKEPGQGPGTVTPPRPVTGGGMRREGHKQAKAVHAE